MVLRGIELLFFVPLLHLALVCGMWLLYTSTLHFLRAHDLIQLGDSVSIQADCVGNRKRRVHDTILLLRISRIKEVS